MVVRHFRIVLEGTITNLNLEEYDLLDPMKDVFGAFLNLKMIVIHMYLWFMMTLV